MKHRTLLYISLSLFLVALLASLWSVGLVRFVDEIGVYSAPVYTHNSPEVEAIVVLTGGRDRVKTGFDLLAAGKGKKLLISGVYPGVETRQIMKESALSQDKVRCCVVLGHAAEDTRGNAQEASVFMRAEGFTSMQLVTSHYHMPRSLLLFRHEMPDIKIIPYPVLPDIVDLSSWLAHAGTRQLLIAEYHKYLIVQLGLFLEAL